ncbi:hypothetical protein HispidOSU_019917 [Sigmodon hispidus]
MLSDLEQALESIVEVYHKYSQLQRNKHALYRDDLQKLLSTECSQYLQKKNADTIFREMDINQDQAINFEEFLVLLIKLQEIKIHGPVIQILQFCQQHELKTSPSLCQQEVAKTMMTTTPSRP